VTLRKEIQVLAKELKISEELLTRSSMKGVGGRKEET